MLHFLSTCIHVYIYVISCACPAGQPSCVTKTLTLDNTRKLFSQNVSILAKLIDTINFYHLIPLSVTLALAASHKVSAKQNLVASFSCIRFQLIRLKFGVVLKQFKLNILKLGLNESYQNKANK